MRWGIEESFILWLGFWGFVLHDDGWFLLNSKRRTIACGTAPNTGWKRPWWRRA